MRKLRIGLYGTNGHQIQQLMENHPRAELVATAHVPRESLPESLRDGRDLASLATLDELLADARVELVSLCSPRRRDQAKDAVRCLEAGKHVYAEKPCAMTEAELDRLLAVAAASGREFHDMGGTAFAQPYLAMRDTVRSGVLGTIVQVLAQKSYPYHDRRPQDEDVDGGLIGQNAIHAVRFVEHVAGVRFRDAAAIETSCGNPVAGGGLRMAACLMGTLENGGVAAIVANYLNPGGFGAWGNEHLRIFGTRGFVESVDGGARTRLVVGSEDRGALDTSAPDQDYFDRLARHILDGVPMPLTLEEELHPTRVVIRAKAAAGRGLV